MGLARRSTLLVLSLTCTLAALGDGAEARRQTFQPRPAQPVPDGRAYRKLTDSPRSVTNFNVEVVRGFVLQDVGEDVPKIWAINAYESTLLEYQGLASEPVARHRTLTNPVAVVEYDGDLLVVGQGSHALARHDLPGGEIVDLLALPSEPADIVVDTDNAQAWVACMGDDAVVQIDLEPRLSIARIWSWEDGLLLKRPRFLALDLRTPSPDDNVVYVAPMVSGNNTLFVNNDLAPDIVDGATLPGGGLPDEDLFRISTGPDLVEPVVRGAGSLLLAHGLNPVTGDYWMLGVDHLNIEAGMLSEPTVRGKFATNQLALTLAATLAANASPPPAPDTLVDLDDFDPATPGAQYQSDRSVSFPYALAFEPGTGRAAIASSTTPLVVLTDANGTRLQDFRLTDPGNSHQGSVARTVAFHGGGLYVYCQESANILAFRTTGGGPLVAWDLGNDPTPAPVRRGRRIWYDAEPSLDGRVTCNTCHPQGGADGLAWLISNQPVDEKGNMVTQTLLGIEDSFPYHWRGERDLEAFNVAFPGLLGTAEELDEATELADFVEFVFSLTPAANPLQSGPLDIDAYGRLEQDLDRRVKQELFPDPIGEGIAPTGSFMLPPGPGNAELGDDVFHDIPTIGGRSCQECHLNPTGTNGDVLSDAGGPINSAAIMKVAHLDTQLPLKHQPIVQVDLGPGNGVQPRNLLGFGTSHKGDRFNLFHFNVRFLGVLTEQEIFDLTAFVHLADHGIAPAAHFAERLHAGALPLAKKRVRNWLLAQAGKDWVGVVAFGTFPDRNGIPARIHWEYDPVGKLFHPDDAALADPQPFSAFTDYANHPELDNVFLGVPPGNEHRLGVDFDDDGLDTGEELAANTDPWNPDTDGDGWPDGYELDNMGDPNVPDTPTDVTDPTLVGSVELDFVSAVAAKLHFEASEPVTWEITLTAPGVPTITEDRATADRIHTAVVQRLAPSTKGFGLPMDVPVQYTGTLVLRDLSGRTSQPIQLPLIETASMFHTNGMLSSLHVGQLDLVSQVRTATSYSARADLRIDFREQAPPATPAANRVIVAQLLKQAANGLDWEIVPGSDIVHDAPATDFGFGMTGQPYGQTPGLLPGPFLVLDPTDLAGTRSVTFTVSGLNAAQKVMVNVLTVFEAPAGWDPQNPVLPPMHKVLGEYNLPGTPAGLRRATSTL